MLQGEALSQLQQAGLSAQVFNEYSDVPRGEVMGQLPPATVSVPTGSEAVLLVSGGPAPATTVTVPLPDVVGMSEADALARLQAAGLAPQTVRDYSQTVPLGVVIAQLPGSQLAPEVPRKKRSLWWLWLLLAFAIIFAASGAVYYYLNRMAAVPNVVGLTQLQAEEAISAAGFKIGSVTTTQTLSATDVGKIAEQSPLPGTQLRLVDRVNITVSGGQRLFAVPDVTGKPQEEARSILTTAGMQVSISQAYNQSVPKDSVI
jgi:serine/threonine-protein kinase